jgi:hypothetical protein
VNILWATFRKTKAGIKLHLRLKFFKNNVLPDEAVITPTKPADKAQMDAHHLIQFYLLHRTMKV